jgi:hypothetical protein
MKTIPCPDCDGSGIFDRIDVWIIRCCVCNGTGTIEVPTTQEDLDELGILASADDLDLSCDDLQDET